MFDPWISLADQYHDVEDLTEPGEINFKAYYDSIAEQLGGVGYDEIELVVDNNTMDIDGWTRWVIKDTFGVDDPNANFSDLDLGECTLANTGDLQLTVNDEEDDDYIPLTYDLYHNAAGAPIAIIVYGDVVEVFRVIHRGNA